MFCEELQRRVGERVRAGEAVATVGATGRASGPHRHFVVRRNGAAQDPHDWLDLRAAA
jgi:murein DD-endopeptidase MepM/ murein hydrolase activator NlpD